MKKFVLTLLALLSIATGVNAQEKIRIYMQDNTVKEFFISDIKSMDFYEYQPVLVDNVKLNQISKELNVGGSFQLAATILPDDAEVKTVKWYANNDNVSLVVPKDSTKCTVTAKAVGESVVTVTVNGKVTASCKIKITEVPNTNPVKSISFSSNPLYIRSTALYRSQNIVANISPIDASNPACIWEIEDESILQPSNLNTPDNSLSVKLLGYGTTKVTVRTVDGNHTATTTVVVTASEIPTPTPTPGGDEEEVVLVSSITLSNMTLTAGESGQMTYSVLPSNAKNKSLSWTSSDNSIATVSQNGTVSAIKEGEVIITATAKDASGKSATAKVTVTKPEPVAPSVRVSDASGVNNSSASVTIYLSGTLDEVDQYGIVYGTSQQPTLGTEAVLSTNSIYEQGNTFAIDLANLAEQTTYYYRGYIMIGNDVIYSSEKTFSTTSSNPYPVAEMVDLGLSVKWASWNLGASSVADYGGIYAWADNTGLAQGSVKYPASCENVKQNICGTQYDLAHVQWKGQWHMPTVAEINELHEKCNWEYVENYQGSSVNGFIVTSKDPSIKAELFIPRAGNYYSGRRNNIGTVGYYWTGEFDSSNGKAKYATFQHVMKDLDYDDWTNLTQDRHYGASIRPVYGEINYVIKGDPGEEEAEDAGNAVDLGLSFLISDRNLGASKPEDIGGFYSWGETETKKMYTKNTYCSGYDPLASGATGDIKNTEFDAAKANWGGKWRMPSRMEFMSLIEDCTWTPVKEGDAIIGYKITGKTGNSIYLPTTGQMSADQHLYGGEYGYTGYYWTTEFNYRKTTYDEAYAFELAGEAPTSQLGYKIILGLCIRPVKSK